MRAGGGIGQVPTSGSRGESEKANEPTHLVEVVQVADVALSRNHGERGGERGGAQGHAHDGHLAKYVRRRLSRCASRIGRPPHAHLHLRSGSVGPLLV